ncbi:MAG: hypothetical protein IIZ44_04885 [Muribaculaceae bacterium]|jgi:hypothetical protein|nr:hypothetical protein [Muribaculaceae bacterium]MBQ1585416.1 hypothetical protein [Muribaculaceae bacterium]MBR0493121.1 hypothetical protein [Muribaculaceae bacterium]MBR3727713.1 hypothetical protein [Muribaculaceae bacterium]
MKKTTLLLVLLVSSLMGIAQDVLDIAPAQVSEVEGFNPAAKRVYAELSCEGQLFSTKVKVSIDFGQSTSWLSSMSESRLVDRNGKDIKFNSMIDALNYLAQFGWRFAQAYVVPRGTRDEVGGTTYWILYKDVDDYSQISEGFTTRRQQRGN